MTFTEGVRWHFCFRQRLIPCLPAHVMAERLSVLFNYRCPDAWWRQHLASFAEVDNFFHAGEIKEINPLSPSFSSKTFYKPAACGASDYIEPLKHNQTVNMFVYHGTAKHVWPHWCQRNTQAAASFTTFVWGRERERDTGRDRDGTAVLLNLDRKVVKLDLWLISSVTLRFSRLIRWQPACHQLGGGERMGGGGDRPRLSNPSHHQSLSFFFFFSQAYSDAITITEMYTLVQFSSPVN